MSTIWQTFRGGPVKAVRNNVGASIDKRGRISLSRAALSLIGSPSHVVLHYDERNSVIGITPSNAAAPGAFLVKPRAGDCGCTIQVQRFCLHFRIRVDGTERFDEPHLDENGILRLDLKRTHRIAQQNPRPKRTPNVNGRPEP